MQIVHYLQENPRLLEGENGKRIERVLDRLVEKIMKSHDTNEVRNLYRMQKKLLVVVVFFFRFKTNLFQKLELV